MLPESLFSRRTSEMGRGLQDELSDEWLWKGRRLKVADGSTASMPDTPANQRAYATSQAKDANGRIMR
jgi:hypothetical protein